MNLTAIVNDFRNCLNLGPLNYICKNYKQQPQKNTGYLYVFKKLCLLKCLQAEAMDL